MVQRNVRKLMLECSTKELYPFNFYENHTKEDLLSVSLGYTLNLIAITSVTWKLWEVFNHEDAIWVGGKLQKS